MLNAVRFEITDLGRWQFHYRPDVQRVVVSRKALEIVWASCHAYLVAYRRAFEDTPGTERAILDVEGDAELNAAFDLLGWAQNDWNMGADTPWPAGLPAPVEEDDVGAPFYHSSQLCKIALAFLLHHELAHHRLGHHSSEVQTEHDADYGAASWLLGELDEADSRFIFRAWGVTVALGMITGSGIHRMELSAGSHPRPFDRLYQTLARVTTFGHHPAWLMAVVVLRLHLDSSHIDVPSLESYYDARSAVDAWIEALAEWERAHRPPDVPDPRNRRRTL